MFHVTNIHIQVFNLLLFTVNVGLQASGPCMTCAVNSVGFTQCFYTGIIMTSIVHSKYCVKMLNSLNVCVGTAPLGLTTLLLSFKHSHSNVVYYVGAVACFVHSLHLGLCKVE